MHCLIVGKTESGKTTFAVEHLLKQHARDSKTKGVIIFDRDFSASPRWKKYGANIRTTGDLEAFKEMVFSSVHCAVVIEEIADLSTADQEFIRTVASKGRHLGHNVYMLAQRPRMIRPNLRSQSTAFAVFTLAPEDVKAMREVFDAPELEGAPQLQQGGCFLKAGSYAPVESGRAF